jgi:hypothetical protein
MRTYRHWGRIETYEAPEAYVRRVMVNANISAWGRRKAIVHVMAEPPEPLPGTGGRGVHGAHAGQGDHQDTYALRDELWRAVCAMSPRMRTPPSSCATSRTCPGSNEPAKVRQEGQIGQIRQAA